MSQEVEMLYAPWYRQLEENRNRFWKRQIFRLTVAIIIFGIGFYTGLSIGVKRGKALGIKQERQSPEYKTAKAKWINLETDIRQMMFLEKIKTMIKEGKP